MGKIFQMGRDALIKRVRKPHEKTNIVTAKQIQLPFGLTATGAMVIFPITYMLSDIFSEVYGYRWSRITCYIAFAMNVLMVAVFQIVILAPAPEYFGSQSALEAILGSVPRVFVASMLGLLTGDFVNDRVFRAMKRGRSDMRGFGARAIASSAAGELADSTVFITLAFCGTMPVSAMVIMGLTEVAIKVSYEIVILPVTTRVCAAVSKRES